MVKIQKAQKNPVIENHTDKTTLIFLMSSKASQFFSLIFMCLFCLWIFVLLISTVWVLMDKSAPEGSWIWPLVHAGITGFLFWNYTRLKNKKTTNTVTVSKGGVDIKGKRYPLSDIDGISYQFGKTPISTNSNIAAASHQHFEESSGIIELSFGNQKVSVATGLQKQEVESAYIALSDALELHGYIFNNKN